MIIIRLVLMLPVLVFKQLTFDWSHFRNIACLCDQNFPSEVLTHFAIIPVLLHLSHFHY
ncbi:MAG: hypothetical protein ACTS4T_01335 [Candidatus Hodgkinia cicadicola]